MLIKEVGDQSVPSLKQNFAKLNLCALIGIALIFAKQVYAQNSPSHDEQVRIFAQGNFAASAVIGEQLAIREPQNATARYYYAQALLKLGRRSEALEQFTQSLAAATDSTLKTYCQKAIQTLSPPAKLESLVVLEPEQVDATQPAAEKDDAMFSLKLRVMEDAAREIKFLRKRADDEIQVVKTRVSEQINGIPKFTYTGASSAGGQNQWPNPYYKETMEKIRIEIAAQTEKIEAAFAKREAEIAAISKRRTDDYDRISAGIRSQQKPGTSLMQMTPQHSNIYIRQYVNYDGSTEAPLKARPSSLPRSTTIEQQQHPVSKNIAK